MVRILDNYSKNNSSGVLLYSDFLDFTERYCFSYIDFNEELSHFWVKLYETKPDKERLKYVIVNFFFLTGVSDRKVEFLCKFMAPEYDFKESDEIIISRKLTHRFLFDYLFSFTTLTLLPFKDCYDDEMDFGLDYELAFTEHNINLYIEENFFVNLNKIRNIDLLKFLPGCIGKLQNIPEIQKEMRVMARKIQTDEYIYLNEEVERFIV